jgi:glycosyltransferase involved in cell wall biosynthesis
MNVLIANVKVPFVYGGAEVLADGLDAALRQRGHQVQRVDLPFKWYPYTIIPNQILATRLLEVHARDDTDLLIGLKFPAYMLRFPNKKMWLLHQLRQVYDLWNTPYQELPNTLEGYAVRQQIVAADNAFIPESREIYTISRLVAQRLETHNGIQATGVLYPPLQNNDLYTAGETGDYLFFPSRLTAGKRQELVIEAMRYVKAPLRVVFAGKSDTPQYQALLERRIAEYDVRDKVTLLGYVSEAEKARYLAGCFAVIFTPLGEDYGYVTLEAMLSHKPVITCTDSGGPTEFVTHNETGLVLPPEPQALAAGIDALYVQRARVREMGEHAYDTIQRQQIDWDHTVERLLS